MSLRSCLFGFFLAASCVHAAAALHAAEVPDFTRDIRPILSDKCFRCHGADETTREGAGDGLRLDTDSGAKADLGGYAAIVPGNLGASELVKRIESSDADLIMPPPTSGKSLTPQQRDLLKRWVEAGAPYREHWAFVKPQAVPPPPVKQRDWVRNEIDAFVLSRLEQEGLAPSPAATKETLLRRVSLDLIGLPPTLEQRNAFLSDHSPNAYEKVVDELLASPHYGERWARRWLDLARYADTNGYEKDRPRTIWPYRDWVIRSLNDDLPFDQFTIRQLAGDMLPEPSLDDRIATGFHRNTMLNEEGGIDPLEFRYYALVDRVNTTSATWLGLTAGCAQCHTHKYDPLTHREYFGLFALLNNADEPTLEIVSPEQQQERVRLRAEIAQLEAELPAQFPAKGPASEQATTPPWQAAFTAWEQQAKGQAAHWQTVTPVSYASSLPLLTLEADQSLVSSGDISKRDTFTLVLPPSTEPIVAVRLEALADPRLPGGGPGRVYYEGPTGDFFLSEIVATAGDKTYPFRSTRHSFASGKFDSKFAIDGDQQSGWAINGRQGDDHRAAFYFETPVPAGTSLKLELLFERYYAAPLGRFRVAVSSDPRAPESSLWPPEVEAALVTPADKRSAEQQNILLRHFCSVAPELAPARKKIDALRNQLRAGKTSLVFQEWPSGQQRPTVRYHRGEYLQPRESVAPGVPAFLPPLPAGATANRLSLAQWLVSRENPLTARVIVNRHWQAFFGRGLVRTLEDFGAQGELPSHSELLDYLAVQFMEQGWSQKKLLRLIVTSATYQQATHGSQQLRERDPQNRLLARGPRVRLDAEQIRDSVLAAAGLLSAKMYGPSVFPPQPASVTSEGTYGKYNWVVSTGEDRYRRSLYTFAKRTAPFAMYTTFDGPPGEFCFVRREISNSPLQGLTLLNDAMFLEAAQALGRTLSAATASDEERISLLFQRSLTREPTAAERETLLAFLAQQRARLASQEIKPEAIAGEGPAEQVAERAAWTLTARIVLNLDEMITKP